MDEQQLRRIAQALRAELSTVIDDDAERRAAAADLERALALPDGPAKGALRQALRKRAETRAWVAAHTGEQGDDPGRSVPSLLGDAPMPALRFVCPKRDYDRFFETPPDDPGRCPIHGLKLEREAD
jgi:hypothetical protein